MYLSESPTRVASSHLIRKRGRLEYPPPAALVSSLLNLRAESVYDWPRFDMLQQQERQVTVADSVRVDGIQVRFVERIKCAQVFVPLPLGRSLP